MNTKKKMALTLTAFASMAGTVSATVLNVPGTYPTIQAGINAASPGDTVLVANGTYAGAGNHNINTLGEAMIDRNSTRIAASVPMPTMHQALTAGASGFRLRSPAGRRLKTYPELALDRPTEVL